MRGIGARLKSIFSGNRIDEETFEDIEDLLVEADIGAAAAMETVDQLRKERGVKNREELILILRNKLKEYLLEGELSLEPDKLNVVLVLGVNGVGKTTSIAKLASLLHKQHGMEPLLAAGDTFRAAAIDQLMLHGERLGFKVVHQHPGSDPGAVVWDAIESAQARKCPLVLADTAGRMHNKQNLVNELKKIDGIVQKRKVDGAYRKVLVIDATTGQNGLRQAEIFHEAVGLDGIILTKFDSAAKGGIILSICRNLKVPFLYLCDGEGYDNIRGFRADDFLDTLLAEN
ncbi:signal recognition particle-docking protein FtsY [Marispirochaeta sp.]|uniref:signal recognition particle-docking protein FtsY n=1 Tax=Marispirochaeta sp. TaxID=2038653 RepID=UPI0029C6E213|nr:signal recognition particle-docking protein FtsY [Marispirochaeta sp.]